jgi:3-hydroxyacyl-[acyl-carrier-protein] dehydratase
MTQSHTPHGPGFRFLDDFTVREGEGIGVWFLAPDLWFFRDHFPGNPLVPAALLMEFAAQTAGALWMSTAGGDRPTPLFVASLDAMRIQGAAFPGETLTANTKLVRELGPLAQFEFEITSASKIVSRGRITLSRQLAGAPAN